MTKMYIKLILWYISFLKIYQLQRNCGWVAVCPRYFLKISVIKLRQNLIKPLINVNPLRSSNDNMDIYIYNHIGIYVFGYFEFDYEKISLTMKYIYNIF